MQASLNPELTELSLERLRLRRSAKWARYPADVLPAWVAEMDFPLAEPMRVALAEAVELDDAGYAWPQGVGLAEAFAEFAAARLGWEVDPAGGLPQLRRRRRRSPRCCGRSPSRATGSSSTPPSTTPSSR